MSGNARKVRCGLRQSRIPTRRTRGGPRWATGVGGYSLATVPPPTPVAHRGPPRSLRVGILGDAQKLANWLAARCSVPSWSAQAGHPRLCCGHLGEVVDGRPSPTMTGWHTPVVAQQLFLRVALRLRDETSASFDGGGAYSVVAGAGPPSTTCWGRLMAASRFGSFPQPVVGGGPSPATSASARALCQHGASPCLGWSQPRNRT